MVGMVGAAILMASVVMFVIGRLKINVGVISIGIDYFQVLGMFSSQKIPWPRVMMILFDYLSAFSFNLDVAAPECAGGGVPVYVKWFMTQFIPIAILVGLLLYTSIRICFLTMQRRKEKEKVEEVKPENAGIEEVVNGQSNTIQSSIDVKIIEQVGMASSMFLSIFYLMYLNMTKKAMDVFNCSPGDPPDDPANPTLFMDMAPDQICYTPGSWETGMHTKLIPWAYACVLAYSMGFPVFIWLKFKRYKEVIFEDQVLFAQDRGRSASTNPNFAFRKRYSKLYKNYKPDKWYWVIIILVKKLGLCFTGLMFKRNPTFQLSVAVMILFWATTMQLNHRPFMSMIERSAIVTEASSREFERGNKLIRKMSAFGGDPEEIEKAKKQLAMEEQAQLQVARALKIASKYFINYNDVEGAFLVCSIFVCLSGVGFASGYFTPAYRQAGSDMMASFVVMCILFSFIYYCYVIGMEITGQKKYNLAINKSKWQSFQKKAAFHKEIFRTTNDNASPEEKEAATRIEAAFKGRKSRQELHDKIMREGTEEQKQALIDLEQKRERRAAARMKKEKKRSKKSQRGKSGAKKKKRSKSGMKNPKKSRRRDSSRRKAKNADAGERFAEWG